MKFTFEDIVVECGSLESIQGSGCLREVENSLVLNQDCYIEVVNKGVKVSNVSVISFLE